MIIDNDYDWQILERMVKGLILITTDGKKAKANLKSEYLDSKYQFILNNNTGWVAPLTARLNFVLKNEDDNNTISQH